MASHVQSRSVEHRIATCVFPTSAYAFMGLLGEMGEGEANNRAVRAPVCLLTVNHTESNCELLVVRISYFQFFNDALEGGV